MPEVATPNQAEREFETGTDEFHKGMSNVHALNAKRTYDEYQDIALTTARRSQIQHDTLQQLNVQAIQNALVTQDMAAKAYLTTVSHNSANIDARFKQAMELNALASDSYWNPVSAGAGMNLTAGAVPANRATDVASAATGVAAAGQAVNAEAVSSAVAIAVNAALTPLIAQLASIANVIAQVQPKEAK